MALSLHSYPFSSYVSFEQMVIPFSESCKAAYQLSRRVTQTRSQKENLGLGADNLQTGKSTADSGRCLFRILDKGSGGSIFLNKICNTEPFCLPFKLFDIAVYHLVVAAEPYS
jgi:hypothetical protein